MLWKALLGTGMTCAFSLVVCANAASIAAGDVVIVAADDVTVVHGNWQATPSTTEGLVLASADAGWSATQTPRPNPSHYFDVTFSASANVPYRIWLRMAAAGDSKWNDSVWVQFSDAVAASGARLYAIGSPSGLLVNLEPCSGCGVSGWQWVNRAWWLTQTSIVRFRTTGTHTIRIQTREDGAEIDQIVLSPSKYFSSAPVGGFPSPAPPIEVPPVVVPPAVTPPVASPPSEVPVPLAGGPFTGVPLAVPGTIEAEDFDSGGEGRGYHDTSVGNAGGQYRSTDVDIENSVEGGYNVGWLAPGEWLAYTVAVARTGQYRVDFRVASIGSGGAFHLEAAGSNLTGVLAMPDTGGWQNWTTVTATVPLTGGTGTLRLVMDTAAESGAVGNFNDIRLSEASNGPYLGVPARIPGALHARDFDGGGEGVAYHDTTAGNSGGRYRAGDVDIEDSSENGHDVGWMATGEWINYTVDVAAAGRYTVDLRVASPGASGRMHLTFGTTATSTIEIPNTGDWQRFLSVKTTIALSPGIQVMRLIVDTGGFNVGAISVATATDPAAPGTIAVNAGDDLQAAIDAARPGDTILLQPGATFTGNFVLPAKNGSSYITIRSGAPDSALPPEGVRIDPSYAPVLAKIQSPNSMPAISTSAGAHHYRLLLLEIGPNRQGLGDIVTLGDGSSAQNTLASVPYALVVDRCYVHGDPSAGQKRGIGLNSASTVVMNSYISDIKTMGQDSQALAGWNGPGPFTIVNNYLEAAGENIIFGGADPAIPDLVPADIVVRNNYVSKPLEWRSQGWLVKNLFELKNAERVVVDGNVFEYNWLHGQVGYAILFTVRNQDGTAPWSVVQDVQFTNNVVRHVASGINILGSDDNYPSREINGITIRNNLFEDVSGASYGGSGRFLLINGGRDITVDHNTVLQDGWTAVYGYGVPVQNFVFRNNIIPDYSWALMGDSVSPGNGTVAAYFPNGIFEGNVFAGADESRYPAGNYYPADMTSVGLVDLTGGNYRLSPSSPYRGLGTDNTDVGVDVDALNRAAGTRY